MLSSNGLTALCQRLGLSDEARATVESIRSAPPSRRVRGAAGNVAVRYPSRKMGVVIQAESHRNELAGLYEKEHDPETVEFYDQPPPIKLLYQASNGRPVGVLHTPDYFVIRTDSLGWEEWKTEEELPKLSEKMPNRYVRGEEGSWCCPPGEHYASQFGFFYRVRYSAEIDWVLQRNLLFLEDYLRVDCPPVAENTAGAILALVVRQPGIRLDELLRQLEGVSSDDLYTLIATDRLHVDLRAAALAEPERVAVFRDQETARAFAVIARAACPPPTDSGRSLILAPGSPVLWDDRRWTVVNPGRTTISLLAEDATPGRVAQHDSRSAGCSRQAGRSDPTHPGGRQRRGQTEVGRGQPRRPDGIDVAAHPPVLLVTCGGGRRFGCFRSRFSTARASSGISSQSTSTISRFIVLGPECCVLSRKHSIRHSALST